MKIELIVTPPWGKEKRPLGNQPEGRSRQLLTPLACGSSGSHIRLKERVGVEGNKIGLKLEEQGAISSNLVVVTRNKRQRR